MGEVCNMHEQEVGAIKEIQTDIKWIRTAGFLWLKIVGGAIIMLIPMMVAFFIFIARLDGRVTMLEDRVEKIETRRQ